MKYIGHNYTDQITEDILEINHGFEDFEDEEQPQKAMSIYIRISTMTQIVGEELDILLEQVHCIAR